MGDTYSALIKGYGLELDRCGLESPKRLCPLTQRITLGNLFNLLFKKNLIFLIYKKGHKRNLLYSAVVRIKEHNTCQLLSMVLAT